MAKLGRGGIIFLGSLTGNGGMANVATYGGSKAFTQIFGEALWTELKPHGIDVLVLIVGAADTPARRRSGFGNPMAVNQCDEVAQWGLDNLANGPVYVLPLIADMFKQMCSLPRREVVEWVGSKVPVPHRQ